MSFIEWMDKLATPGWGRQDSAEVKRLKRQELKLWIALLVMVSQLVIFAGLIFVTLAAAREHDYQRATFDLLLLMMFCHREKQ